MAPTTDTPLEETAKLEQKGLSIFAWAAKATGGNVSAKNKKWYLIDFKWDPEGKWRLSDKEAALTLLSQDGGK